MKIPTFKLRFKLKTALIHSIILLSLIAATQAQWNQLGIDITGQSNGDYFGQSVSLSADGLTISIGAPQNDGTGIKQGQVRVYKSTNGMWTQLGKEINGEANSDLSGGALSLSADGSTLAIGAAFNDGGGIDRGQVRIYKLINDDWIQQGTDIDGESDNDRSGEAVSISPDGTIVAIGAPQKDAAGSLIGNVRVFKLVKGLWTQIGSDLNGDSNNNRFGTAISLSYDGSTLAIGAPGNKGGGTSRGQVRVYKLINNIWIQQGASINGDADFDQLGTAVSLSYDGNTIGVSAPFHVDGGLETGQVRIFNFINGVWIQQGFDINGQSDGDNSGNSISFSSDGKTVAIGAQLNSDAGNKSGEVRVYKYILGNWIQQGFDIDGEAAEDLSGHSVSLSADGSLVAIGAPFNGAGGSAKGQARVYYFGPQCIPASITCPANIIVNTTVDSCNAIVNYSDSIFGTPDPKIAYSFNGSTISNGNGDGSCSTFNKGITTVTLTVANICANQNCSFIVTVNDNQFPRIRCPDNITQIADPGMCSKSVSFSATADDNCPGTLISFSPTSGSSFNVGIQAVTATATDACGNSTQCTFFVTIKDLENPIIACPANITQSATIGSCGAIVAFVASVADNCPVATINFSQASGALFKLGTTVDTATVTDASGNSAQCTFSITIQDKENPTITCPPDITQSAGIGSCSALTTFIAASIDNCTSTSISYSAANGSSFNVGTTIVTAISTDESGNTAQCVFQVTIKDNEKPEIHCPANIIKTQVVGIDSQLVTFNATASDNCGMPIINYSPENGSLFKSGTTLVTATAYDGGGNSSKCTFTVTVEGVAPYKISDIYQGCYASTFCIPITATAQVDNIIGYDIVMTYNPLKVYPTGLVKISNDLIDSTIVEVVNSIDVSAAKINISAYLSGGASPNAKFSGTGSILCVQFAKKPEFKDIDTALFNVISLTESYPIGIQNKSVNSGEYKTYRDSLFFASLRFWMDDSPIKYDKTKPDEYLVTNVLGNDDACKNKSTAAVQPDTLGKISYNISNGLEIEIERDILNNNSLQPAVNGFDAYLVSRLLNIDPTFTPSIYQMMAMDVNMDGLINPK